MNKEKSKVKKSVLDFYLIFNICSKTNRFSFVINTPKPIKFHFVFIL